MTASLVIGAMTTWDELERSARVRPFARSPTARPASATSRCETSARSAAGSPTRTRRRTCPPCTIALGARLTVRSKSGERTIDAAELALGPFMTSLAEGELITEVVIPVPRRGLRLGVRRDGASGVRLRARGRGSARRRGRHEARRRDGRRGRAVPARRASSTMPSCSATASRRSSTGGSSSGRVVDRATALAEQRAKEDAK